MPEKPSLLPVLIGAGAVGIELVDGLLFSAWPYAALVVGPGQEPGGFPVAGGQRALMAAPARLQVPAGIGILMNRPLGRDLAQATALAVLILGLLGAGAGAVLVVGVPEVLLGTFACGFMTALPRAIALAMA
jgi:hypothetical protein